MKSRMAASHHVQRSAGGLLGAAVACCLLAPAGCTPTQLALVSVPGEFGDVTELEWNWGIECLSAVYRYDPTAFALDSIVAAGRPLLSRGESWTPHGDRPTEFEPLKPTPVDPEIVSGMTLYSGTLLGGLGCGGGLSGEHAAIARETVHEAGGLYSYSFDKETMLLVSPEHSILIVLIED